MFSEELSNQTQSTFGSLRLLLGSVDAYNNNFRVQNRSSKTRTGSFLMQKKSKLNLFTQRANMSKPVTIFITMCSIVVIQSY